MLPGIVAWFNLVPHKGMAVAPVWFFGKQNRKK